MQFVSLDFAIFLVLAFVIHWLTIRKSARAQNLFLLVISVLFYIFNAREYLLVLLAAATGNYFLGRLIHNTKAEETRKWLLRAAVVTNIFLLGYFKYFEFLYSSFVSFVNTGDALNIIVPLGISFYTFQMIGYLIDIYNEEIEPERDILQFILYVSYFPKIFAGPIERAQNFLPQIKKLRIFSYELAADGLRQFLWGLFAKVVIADNCTQLTENVFGNYQNYSGATLILAAFLYAFQVYCDFSGYSNMAIGVSKLFGIRLMRNFSYPFFSVNISAYWQRWHISLSSWMMNYLFTPLSFALRSFRKAGLIISIVVTFLVVGLWHGANWNFLFFGFLHGLYFIPIVVRNKLNKPSVSESRRAITILKMVGTFLLVMFTMVVFRLPVLNDIPRYFSRIAGSLGHGAVIEDTSRLAVTLVFILFLLIIEWRQRSAEHALQVRDGVEQVKFFGGRLARWSLYMFIFFSTLVFTANQQDFIYLKF